MPYFIILPVYVLLLVALIVAAIVTRFVPQLQPASAYIVGGTVGTLPAFVVANILVTLAGLLPVWAAQKMELPQRLHDATKFFVAAVLLVGPFVASAIGVFLGFALGVYFVFRRRRSHAS